VQEVFEEIIKGYRLAKPCDCPQEVYHAMLACWSPQRPSFRQIEQYLAALLDPSLPHPPPLLVRELVCVLLFPFVRTFLFEPQ
jgi:hypothetical protein